MGLHKKSCALSVLIQAIEIVELVEPEKYLGAQDITNAKTLNFFFPLKIHNNETQRKNREKKKLNGLQKEKKNGVPKTQRASPSSKTI